MNLHNETTPAQPVESYTAGLHSRIMSFSARTANRSDAVARYREIGMVRSANGGRLRREMSDYLPRGGAAPRRDALSTQPTSRMIRAARAKSLSA
jgi:hypothetical protein